MISSPFRYPGGKYYARRLILPRVPPHQIYCEPFVGGGSVFFGKEPRVPSVLNDLAPGLMNTLQVIRDRPSDLIDMLKGVPATKEMHTYIRTGLTAQGRVSRAAKWFYLNRTSYSGIIKGSACSWGYRPTNSLPPEKWPERIRQCSASLSGALLLAHDFETVIDALPVGAFVFVDPPYYASGQSRLYECAFILDDHLRLARCLLRNSGRLQFLLTYDDHPDVRALYRWARLTDHQWAYRLAQKKGAGSRGKTQELFIENYKVTT